MHEGKGKVRKRDPWDSCLKVSLTIKHLAGSKNRPKSPTYRSFQIMPDARDTDSKSEVDRAQIAHMEELPLMALLHAMLPSFCPLHLAS
jgi:hypothetical protein